MLAELLQHLGAHPRLQVLDLTPVLRRRRDELQLYYRADSHWNGQGAFLAAQAIADRLRQSLPNVGTIRDDDYVRADVPIKGGDLLNMLRLGLNVYDRMFLYQRRTGAHGRSRRRDLTVSGSSRTADCRQPFSSATRSAWPWRRFWPTRSRGFTIIWTRRARPTRVWWNGNGRMSSC